MSSSHHGSAAPCALCDSYPMHPMGPPQGIAGLPLPGYHTLNLKRGTYSQISAANSIYGANGHAPQQPPQPDEIVETLRRLRSHSVSPPKGSADFWSIQNNLNNFDKISNLTKILHTPFVIPTPSTPLGHWGPNPPKLPNLRLEEGNLHSDQLGQQARSLTTTLAGWNYGDTEMAKKSFNFSAKRQWWHLGVSRLFDNCLVLLTSKMWITIGETLRRLWSHAVPSSYGSAEKLWPGRKNCRNCETKVSFWTVSLFSCETYHF